MTDTEMHKKIKLEKVNAAKAAEGEKRIEKPTWKDKCPPSDYFSLSWGCVKVLSYVFSFFLIWKWKPCFFLSVPQFLSPEKQLASTWEG